MIKIRVQGLPEEVAEFADALEAAGCVLERSEPYANRGGSRYVRVYIDARKPAADGGAREIEEGEPCAKTRTRRASGRASAKGT